MARRFQWPRRGAAAARAGSAVVSAEVEDDDVNEDTRSAFVEPAVLIGASLDGGSKFDTIWNNNGPTPTFRQLLHLPPKEEPQQRNGTIEDFANRHSQELTDKSKTLSSEVESGPAISCRPNYENDDDKTQREEKIQPASASGTTRLQADGEDSAANRSGLEGGASIAASAVGATTATAAKLPPLRPPSMFHLKRWSPPRRTAVPVAEASSSDDYPRVVKHANSSDLEATQVSDADLGDVGNALDRKSSNGNMDGSVGGSVNSLNHCNNNSNNAKDLDDDDQEVQSAANVSNSNSYGEAGIEMSLRQYRRRYYLARMASWRDSLQDLKRRRRRCFWSTVALLILVLLLIVILASSCGGGKCSSSQQSAAAKSTTSETMDPKFGRLTRAPNASPSTPTSAPADAANTDDDAVVNQHDPLDALLGGSNPNIVVFTPTMTTSDIQAAADAVFNLQQNNEMGTERYTIYFLPGSYGSYEEPLYLQIGYYTEVAGLGATPGDVVVYGKIEVYNRCFQPDPYKQGLFVPGDGSGLCFALNSFWRSLSNLSIQIVSLNQDSCRATAMFWAVSQAVSMRRVDIRGGDVSLMDYCTSTLLLCKRDDSH
jgi:hypothetical protein